jgi:hypothetical protein
LRLLSWLNWRSDIVTTEKLALFSFGYYGWGNHTPQLVQAVDVVEQARGFLPPIWVDIRIRRSVRAKGFQGPAFEKLLGPERHRWMQELGNRRIITRERGIEIAEPEAVQDLLGLAGEAAEKRRRLIFFCSCQWPCQEGEIACHRTEVAHLLLRAARERGLSVEVVEWPGGEPAQINLDLPADVFRAVRNGRLSIPVVGSKPLEAIAGLPWGSIAGLYSGKENIYRVVGPAAWKLERWCLPVLWRSDSETGLAECKQKGANLRLSLGLGPCSTQDQVESMHQPGR